MKRAILFTLAFLCIGIRLFGQIDPIANRESGASTRTKLNELIAEHNRVLALDGFIRGNAGSISNALNIIPIENGGLGVSISDPNGDRVLYWNDSNNQFEFATVSGGIQITPGNISLESSVFQQNGYDNVLFVKSPADGGSDASALPNSFVNAYATIQQAVTSSNGLGGSNLIMVYAPPGTERLFLEPVDISESTTIYYHEGVIHYWNVAGRPTLRTIGDGTGTKFLNVEGSGQLYHTVGKSGNDSDAFTDFFGSNWILNFQLKEITNANFGRATKADFRDMTFRYAANPPTTIVAESVFTNCRFLSPPVISNMGFIQAQVKFMNCDFDLLSQSEYAYSPTGRLYEITTGISHTDPFTTNLPNNFSGYVNTEGTADVAGTIALYSNFGGFRPDFVSAIEIYYNQPPTGALLVFEECNFNIYKTHCLGVIGLTNQDAAVETLLFRNCTVNDFTIGETASSLFATNNVSNQLGRFHYGDIQTNTDLLNQVNDVTYTVPLNNTYVDIESGGGSGIENLEDDNNNVINSATGTGYFQWENVRIENNTISPVTTNTIQLNGGTSSGSNFGAVMILGGASGASQDKLRLFGGNSGSGNGDIEFLTGGSATPKMILSQSGALVLGGATGGAQGLGTINTTGLFVNGTSVSAISLESGTYTPISTVDPADQISQEKGFYQRVGNIVTVTIQALWQASATTDRSIEFSLPIASNLAAGQDLTGSVGGDRVNYGVIIANPTNDTADVTVNMSNTATRFVSFTFVYEIL